MSAGSAAKLAFFAVLISAGADGSLRSRFAVEPGARSSSAARFVLADSVTVTRAEYVTARHRLYVEAQGPNASATLRVFVTSTNQMLGTLTNRGGGLYRGEFTWPKNPENVTVLNIHGGKVSSAVTLG